MDGFSSDVIDVGLVDSPSDRHLTLLLAYTLSRAHHTAYHDHQDANRKKTHQAIQVRTIIIILP